jgi:hypothetical protein
MRLSNKQVVERLEENGYSQTKDNLTILRSYVNGEDVGEDSPAPKISVHFYGPEGTLIRSRIDAFKEVFTGVENVYVNRFDIESEMKSLLQRCVDIG